MFTWTYNYRHYQKILNAIFTFGCNFLNQNFESAEVIQELLLIKIQSEILTALRDENRKSHQ